MGARIIQEFESQSTKSNITVMPLFLQTLALTLMRKWIQKLEQIFKKNKREE